MKKEIEEAIQLIQEIGQNKDAVYYLIREVQNVLGVLDEPLKDWVDYSSELLGRQFQQLQENGFERDEAMQIILARVNRLSLPNVSQWKNKA